MAPELVPTAAKSVTGFTKPATIPKRAFVTFLAGNGDYVKGVIGLAKGLRKVKTAYPLVVAVLPDVPEEHREMLESQGCIVREIEPVYPPENQTQFAMAYYVINYSKLRIWEFVEYSKMIYLDGDIQVYENIDHLFDLQDGYLYGVMDCLCEKAWSHTPQYKIGYCQQCPNKRHPQNVELRKVKVVHYCAAGSKPWRYTGKEENMQREDIKMLVQKWWDVYNDSSLDYSKSLNGSSETQRNDVETEPFVHALSEVGHVQYVTAPSAA
uniref:Hexosyltransferase n=1 Tax=Cicer arietinum TaxID=3827 RepID=A0A1D6YD62_CICAR|nr:galactinol synthase 1 splice variant [Cicer arietinum]